jgi:hypothetical protein
VPLSTRFLAAAVVGVPAVVVCFAIAITLGASRELAGLLSAGAGVLCGVAVQPIVKEEPDGQ